MTTGTEIDREALKSLAGVERWVGWKRVKRGGDETKVPVSPVTGNGASSTDPATWTDREAARNFVARRGLAGVGLVLGDLPDGRRLGGVDLDACRDPGTGEIAPWAQEIVDLFATYTEVSPSGTGLKFLAVGAPEELPGHVLPMEGPPINGKSPQIEVYTSGRYFTVTGAIIDGVPDEIRDCGDVGDAWDQLVNRLRKQGNSSRHAAELPDEIPAGRRNGTLTSLAGSMRRRGASQASIRAALLEENGARCNPPLDPDEVESIAASVARYAPDEWPDPERLTTSLPDVEHLDPVLLPDDLRPWLTDITERIQCPLDYPAVAAVVGLASVVGRQVAIRPKRADDWAVVPNLWGVIVGRPGVLKTPAVDDVLKPLKRLEVEAREEHEAALRLHGARQEIAGVEAKVRRDDVKKQLKSGASAESLARELAAESADDAEPIRRRHLVNEATVEKLGEILSGNPNGVLYHRDELSGFLRGLERQGREADRAFYLESWNGSGRFTYDRIGRGTVDIEAACVSMLGTIQPGPLRTYLTRGAGGVDDGLIQRFQLAVWPDVGTWENVDRAPDREARERAYGLFARLATLDTATLGAETDPYDDDAIPFLRFDDEAQATFDTWRADLERRVRSGQEHPAIESHLSKYRSLVPSLSLLYHLASGTPRGPVDEAAVLTGIAWAQYLESHTQRIYAPVVGTDTAPAESLAYHVKSGDLEDGFSPRDAYRPQWSGLTDREDVDRALAVLESLGWLRVEAVQTGGRPTEQVRINPKLEVGK